MHSQTTGFAKPSPTLRESGNGSHRPGGLWPQSRSGSRPPGLLVLLPIYLIFE